MNAQFRADSLMKLDCPICGGSGWVCEEHSAHPWPHGECELGKPCICNPSWDLPQGDYVSIAGTTERSDRVTKRAR